MNRFSNRLTAVPALMVFGLCLALAPTMQAAESDLSSDATGPASSGLGDTPLITVNYANGGPDDAGSAYINAFIPSGLPMPMSELTQEAFDALQASAATFDGDANLLTTTDTLGNTPYLFIEDAYCEHLMFQLQRTDDDTDANPIEGLDNGVSASFTFNPQIPMDPPKIGKVTIYEPAGLAQTFRPSVAGENFLNAAGTHRYSRGADCDDDPDGGCSDMSYCFGPRISEVELIDGERELGSDGSARGRLV